MTRTILLCVALSALLGCKGSAKVMVSCTDPKEDGLHCKVEHTEGTAKVKACWTVNITCEDGKVVTGSACQVVEAKQTEETVMPWTDLEGMETCKVKDGKVADVKLEYEK